jgi:hypothetical protein
MVDSVDTRADDASRASTPGAASAAHSAIATNERTPANVATSATANTPGGAWRSRAACAVGHLRDQVQQTVGCDGDIRELPAAGRIRR